ncbi:MAG: hypothetical protein ACI4BH_04125 [Muribaculaceae bacterium]
MNKERLRILYEGCTDKYAAAKEFGSTYQSMYNLLYKEGTTCKVDLLERIAAYFHVPVSHFFDDSQEISAVVSGNGSVAVAGNNNVTGIGDTAVLQERVKMLEKLLDEKERLIKVLMEK